MVSIVITVSDNWMDKFNSVKDKLAGMGMHIEKIMPKLGVISGTVSNPAKFRAVEGVESVNVELNHTLPPSKSKVQ